MAEKRGTWGCLIPQKPRRGHTMQQQSSITVAQG